jgi:hypothetical protein
MPIASARRRTSASSRPTTVVCAADSTRLRPVTAHASRTRLNCAAVSSTDWNGRLNSSA